MTDFHITDDVATLSNGTLLQELENVAVFDDRDSLTDEQANYYDRLLDEVLDRMEDSDT